MKTTWLGRGIGVGLAVAGALLLPGTGAEAQLRLNPGVAPPAPEVAPPSGKRLELRLSTLTTVSFSYHRPSQLWIARLGASQVHVVSRTSPKGPEQGRTINDGVVVLRIPVARDEAPAVASLQSCAHLADEERSVWQGRSGINDVKRKLGVDVLTESQVPFKIVLDGLSADDVRVAGRDVEVRLNHPSLTTFACGRDPAL